MFTHFFSFEIRYWLRGTMLWIFLLVMAVLFFSAVATDKVTVGGGLENTYKNAPYVIENFYAVAGILSILMTTAFVNLAAARDYAYGTHQILFSTPLKKMDFLLGRYLASALISLIPCLGVSLGILLAKYMPWIDPERWGPVNWQAHLSGILVIALPNTLFVAAIIFAIAALTRSTITSFVGALVLIVAYGISQALTSDMKNETLAMLLDPFGGNTFSLMTKYWTVAEKNTRVLGLSGMMLWNRLLWLSVSALVLAFACVRFQFTESSGRRWRKKKIAPEAEPVVSAGVLPAATYSSDFGAQVRQFLGATRSELRGLIKSTSFIVITLAALLNTIPSLILSANEGYGNSSLPVTYRVLEVIAGTLYFFLIILITYYAGVLVWRERDARVDEVYDALPHPNWVSYTAKFIALAAAIMLIELVAMLSGIAVQAWWSYHRFQLGFYVSELFGIDLSLFLALAFLAYFIHVLAPNKYIGYFAFIVFLIVNAFAWRPLGIATKLVRFGSRPGIVYSDLYRRAPFLPAWSWFTLYWGLFCLILAVASIILWQRGRETGWRQRLFNARLRTGSITPLALLLATLFAGSGGWIYYNTKMINRLVPEVDQEKLQSEFEKTYKKYEGLPQPRVLNIQYNIEIYPETRNMTMRGDQEIVNESNAPIAQMHVTVADQYDTDIQLDSATLSTNDTRLYYRIYQLSPPLQPAEHRHMRFTVRSKTRGFENEVTDRQLVQNGTFFNNTIAPQIGYQPARELTDRNDRKKYGLPEWNLMPELERNCTAHCGNTYLSNNSDWVDVDTVISTSADQIAIAPGSLLKEWSENGRHYYHYQLDHKSANFYSFISARYQVQRDEWNGVKLEVYYDREHPWNVPKMLRSMRKSLEYYSANFGPYPHKEARILEFPRVARFAQAFPGTMPYSEGIGFIANLKDPDDIDMVFYVTAHEMGHQWWAHQVLGANMQGATLLSETLAQYSALMVMEKEYGRDMMRKFLQYEMDNYLRSRGRELLKERPLLRVEANQGYIHYRKGSVVMYYLKEMIGEDAVNRALRKVVQQYGYADPPYPTSYVLVDALKAETPANLQYLYQDLFDNITLFSNRTLSAKAAKRADGNYDVTIEVETKKLRADSTGVENEVPVNDFIEIGAFAKPDKGKKYGKTLYRERVHMGTGRRTYTFLVAAQPDKAGIDPFALLIDRIPDDNMKSVSTK
jgi:ABC-2 type transport system permease protein